MADADNGGAPALAALENVTREVDAGNPSPEEVAQRERQELEQSDAEIGARAWAQALYAIGGAVTLIAPELRPVYAPERCLEWGQAANEVGKKYGWKTEAMPEIALIASSMSFLVPTVLVIRAKAAQVKEAREATLFGKAVLWWRMRKAKKAGAAAAPQDGGQEAVASGGEQ